jgi:hypothetical protein
MTLLDKQQVFSHNVGLLINYICFMGYTLTLGEVYRTPEQAKIYAKQGKGIIDSLHCKKLAVDLNLFKKGEYLPKSEDYEFAGKYWEKLDSLNRWGGRWENNPDGNHFEMQDK